MMASAYQTPHREHDMDMTWSGLKPIEQGLLRQDRTLIYKDVNDRR